MTIRVEWDNAEKTAILFSYHGPWTWDEFFETADQGDALAATVSHPVHHIYDVTESSSMPSGALAQFRNLRNRPTVNPGRRVLVGASPFIMTITQMMFRIYPNLQKNFLVALTLEKARLLLKEPIAT